MDAATTGFPLAVEVAALAGLAEAVAELAEVAVAVLVGAVPE